MNTNLYCRGGKGLLLKIKSDVSTQAWHTDVKLFLII